nr:MAG TPA: hypothetical protein [Caudoviricetes sp.]
MKQKPGTTVSPRPEHARFVSCLLVVGRYTPLMRQL